MADQLPLNLSAGEDPDPTGAHEARQLAWAQANRVVREARPNPSPEPGDSEEDLFTLAAGSQNGTDAGTKGFENWQRELRERNEHFARKLGLPLGRRVEVVLANGTTLRGLLTLGSPGKGTAQIPRGPGAERAIRTVLPLLIGRTPTMAGDIASCVRIEEASTGNRDASEDLRMGHSPRPPHDVAD